MELAHFAPQRQILTPILDPSTTYTCHDFTGQALLLLHVYIELDIHIYEVARTS